MSTGEDIIRVIKSLDFKDERVVPEVLAAAVHTDLGPLVRSLKEGDSSDKHLLMSTLEHFAHLEQDKEDALPNRDRGKATPPQGAAPQQKKVGAIGTRQLMQVQNLMAALLQRYRALQGDFDNLSRVCSEKDRTIATLEARVSALQSSTALTTPPKQRTREKEREGACPPPSTHSAQRQVRRHSGGYSAKSRSTSPSTSPPRAGGTPRMRSNSNESSRTPAPVLTPQRQGSGRAASTGTATPGKDSSVSRDDERRKRRSETEARQRALLESYTRLHNETADDFTTPNQWVFRSGMFGPGSASSAGTPRRGASPSSGVDAAPACSLPRPRIGYQHVLYPTKKVTAPASLNRHKSLTPPKGVK